MHGIEILHCQMLYLDPAENEIQTQRSSFKLIQLPWKPLLFLKQKNNPKGKLCTGEGGRAQTFKGTGHPFSFILQGGESTTLLTNFLSYQCNAAATFLSRRPKARVNARQSANSSPLKQRAAPFVSRPVFSDLCRKLSCVPYQLETLACLQNGVQQLPVLPTNTALYSFFSRFQEPGTSICCKTKVKSSFCAAFDSLSCHMWTAFCRLHCRLSLGGNGRAQQRACAIIVLQLNIRWALQFQEEAQ